MNGKFECWDQDEAFIVTIDTLPTCMGRYCVVDDMEDIQVGSWTCSEAEDTPIETPDQTIVLGFRTGLRLLLLL